MATEIEKLLITIGADISQLAKATEASTKEIQKIAKQSQKTSDDVAKSTAKINKSFAAITTVAAVKGIKALGSALSSLGTFVLEMGANVEEVQNLFEVAFGDEFTERASSFIDRFAKTMGLSDVKVQNTMASFYMMTESMGLAGKEAYTVAQDMTFLGKELSSLYNKSEDIAWEKIASGLAGNVEPLRQWGISVGQAQLEATALKYGIEGNFNAMTEATKVQLRYLTIMDATRKAQGDSLATYDSLSNSVRRLENRFFEIKQTVATALAPVFQSLLPIINGVADAIAILAQTFANFIGMFTKGSQQQAKANEQVAKSARDMGSPQGGGVPASAIQSVEEMAKAQDKQAKATEKATKVSENQLFKFDELNQLKRETVGDGGAGGGGGSGGGAGGGGGGAGGGGGLVPDFSLGDPQLDLSPIADEFDKIGEAATRLTEILQGLFEPFYNAWQKYGQHVLDALKGLGTSIMDLFAPLGEMLLNVWNNGGKELLQGLSELALVLLEFAINILTPVIDGLGILAEALFPVLGVALEIVIGIVGFLVEKFKEMVEWVNENEVVLGILQGTIKVVTVLLGGIVLAVMGAVLAWNIFWGLNTLLTGAIGILGAAFVFLTSPIGIAVVAILGIIAVGVALYQNWEEVKKFAVELWEQIKNIFSKLRDWWLRDWWEGKIKPWLNEWKDLFTKAADWVKEKWDKVVSFTSGLWEQIKDIFNRLKSWWIDDWWNGRIKPWINEWVQWFKDIPGKIMDAFNYLKEQWDIAWANIKTAVENAKVKIREAIQSIMDKFPGFTGSISDAYTNIKGILTNIINFVKNVFTGNWSGAWENIKNVFGNAWGALTNLAKTPLNAVIDVFNNAIRALNKFKITVPDWVPIVGGKTWGLNISTIPRLAAGGVVSSATVAMIGERGQEAILPLTDQSVMDRLGAVIANSVVDAMAMNNSASKTERPQTVIMELDGIQFGKAVLSSINREKRRTGVRISGIS